MNNQELGKIINSVIFNKVKITSKYLQSILLLYIGKKRVASL